MNIDFETFNLAVKEQFHTYRSDSAILFDYLQDRADDGFAKGQFALYRANYFYRTYATIPSICMVVKSAAEHEDEHTLRSAGQNLMEELGLTSLTKKSHAELLRFSHNKHGELVFRLPSISLQDATKSDFIFKTTKHFKKIQHQLYSSENYIEILAASYAQEEAATEMLTNFLNAFFKPYASLYQNSHEFLEVIEYFNCHLDGLEKRHAEDAKWSLFKQCQSLNDIDVAIEAIKQILNAQSEMWIDMECGLRKREKKTVNNPC